MPSSHAMAIMLSGADRASLKIWTRQRKTAQGLALRVRIALACAEAGTTNGAVAQALGVSRPTVATWRRRFAERGPDGLLDETRPGAPRRITGTFNRIAIGWGGTGRSASSVPEQLSGVFDGPDSERVG